MKILNISMIAVVLATAGVSAAFARGGVHTESPLSSGAVDAYAVPHAATAERIVVAPQQRPLDEQSAAVLRLEEAGDAASEK